MTVTVGNPLTDEHKRRIGEGQRRRHAAANRGPQTCVGCGREFKGTQGIAIHLAAAYQCWKAVKMAEAKADGETGLGGEREGERGAEVTSAGVLD